jgi:1-deoxy-D-xylulose-5-phosphate reductoisomerase
LLVKNIAHIYYVNIMKQDISENTAPKNIAIFGATGTIGDNTLSIISTFVHLFKAHILTASENWQKLAKLAHQFQPELVVIGNDAHYKDLRSSLPPHIEVRAGVEEIIAAAHLPCDAHVAGIMGFAGLAPTFAAIQAGHKIILANKECLVAAGELLMQEVGKHHATIIPVDSEHNGIFQLWSACANNSPQSVILTASGGALRDMPLNQLAHATPAQAIAHPNWSMGAKISVDSATLMNKGLELIEAQHLFALNPEQLQVIIHPQSIVHCLVSFADGSTLAQLSAPDMRIPISYGLHHPARLPLKLPALDLAQIASLNFANVDNNRYPCLHLAYEAMQAGGSAPIILNAANEIAVASFLAGEIRFTDIAALVDATLQHLSASPITTLDEINQINHNARLNATELKNKWTLS